MAASDTDALFLPGWGARASMYAPGLPRGWRRIDPPLRRAPDLAALRRWLVAEIELGPPRPILAGHSLGGALAVLAAATIPAQISSLVLVAPAGLPLTKPLHASAADCLTQLARGVYRPSHAAAALCDFARAPRATIGVARALRSLELDEELATVRRHGVPAVVISCASDTLVTVGHCRAIAQLLGAQHRELSLEGGHMWMLSAPDVFRAELERGGRAA